MSEMGVKFPVVEWCVKIPVFLVPEERVEFLRTAELPGILKTVKSVGFEAVARQTASPL